MGHKALPVQMVSATVNTSSAGTLLRRSLSMFFWSWFIGLFLGVVKFAETEERL